MAVSSMAAVVPAPGQALYSASKAALNAYLATLQTELCARCPACCLRTAHMSAPVLHCYGRGLHRVQTVGDLTTVPASAMYAVTPGLSHHATACVRLPGPHHQRFSHVGRALARLRSTRLPGQGHPRNNRMPGANCYWISRHAAQCVFVARPGGEARSARRQQQAARAAPRGRAHCARGVPVRPRCQTRLTPLTLGGL